MAEGKTYDIPAARFQWFKDQLEKLGRKAKRLTGEKLYCTAVGFHKEEDPKSRWHGQKIMEVFVACPEPKLEGWEFVARIDHAGEVGNVIRATGLRDVPERYRDADPSCDHCQHNRRRRDTFVVFKEDQGYRQVGSSCLKDFVGHGDADRIAKLAELLANIRGYASGSFSGEMVDLRYIDTEAYMAYAAEDILLRGFVSRQKHKDTGDKATACAAHELYGRTAPVSKAARELAGAALAWAMDLDSQDEPLNDYLHNCWVVANGPGLSVRSLGIAASIVGVYKRSLEPKIDYSISQFQGTVGRKIEVVVMVDEVRQLNSGSFLHRLRDRQGNLYTWFASNAGLRDQQGKPVRIQGGVKAHDTYKGVRSTILTRVRAA